MEPFGVGCGQRKADLCLKPGIYEYRFVVDGNWVDDPCARTWVANPFGTRNAVLVVGQDDKAENCTTRNETAIISRSLCPAVPAVGLPCWNSEWQLDRLYYQDTSCSSRVPTHRQIAELAYNLYLQRGKEPGHEEPGHDVDDWLAAEKHLQTLLAVE